MICIGLSRCYSSASMFLQCCYLGGQTYPVQFCKPADSAVCIDVQFSLSLQGARSILGGIQNLHLANAQTIPAVLIRQHAKLGSPLLKSTSQHADIALSDADYSKLRLPAAQSSQASAAQQSQSKPARPRQSFKAPLTPPTSSSLLSGRLPKQSRQNQIHSPSGRAAARSSAAAASDPAPGAVAESPAMSHGSPYRGNESAEMIIPAAGLAADQEQSGALQGSGWSQQQWDELMQSGHGIQPPALANFEQGPPVSDTRLKIGRRRPARPVLKKQRMNTSSVGDETM